MKVLIACEFSQIVTKAFRERGHEAFSCDLLPTEGNSEWHIQDDVLKHLNDGWDLMIAHPPCTYLSKAGARWMYPTAGNLDIERYKKAMQARFFFITLLNASIKYIAIENPLPLKVIALPEHTQIIQPYEYGHEYSKKTLLWLKNLPPLRSTDIKSNYKSYLPSNTGGKKRGQKYQFVNITQKEGSKTFSGVAKAMAEQWG